MGGIAGGEKVSWVVHHFHAHRNVARAYAKVDETFAFTLGIPGVHVIGADFEFERSCHAVVSLKLVIPWLLGMLVEIDEAWRDDQTFCIKNSRSF